VVGDSFVKRLYFYQRHNPMDIGWQGVQVYGWSGAHVEDVARGIWTIPWRGAYSAVVVQVGSNDLCDASHTPAAVVGDILNFAAALVGFGVGQVIVCQILRRTSANHLKGLTVEEYNTAVDATNAMLKAQCTGLVRYWRHNHSVCGPKSLATDGTHLSDHAMRGYVRSIIDAVCCS